MLTSVATGLPLVGIEFQADLLQPTPDADELLSVPTVELPVGGAVVVLRRYLDRTTGEALGVHLERLHCLVEALASALGAALRQRRAGELAQRPAGDVHHGRVGEPELLRGRLDLLHPFAVLGRRGVTRNQVDVLWRAGPLRGGPCGLLRRA